jgi:RNA polymerase sigma factor (sigma-70 family)
MDNHPLHTVIRHLRTVAAPPASREVTDGRLLERYRQDRDGAAFTALVQRHGPLVFNVCRHVLPRREDAEDAFQATFLVLAKGAGSIRKQQSLGSWLHGVAYRVALKARRAELRRLVHERKANAMPRGQATGDVGFRELMALLDEEIQRLAEVYRVPFVLCCLEGKSKAEAAQELGWKEGTVSGRLARARRQLRERLARRGVSLAAPLGALAVTAQPVEAALVKAAVRTALAEAAGPGSAGLVSARIATLAKGVQPAMIVSRFKIATVLLLTGLAALGAGLLGRQALASRAPAAASPASAAKPAAPTRQARQQPANGLEMAGRVLDPRGRPVKGARVVCFPDADRQVSVRALSGVDGRFRLAIPVRGSGQLAAVTAWANGYGPAVLFTPRSQPARDLTLRLVADDVTIKGRVLDLEGNPVAGVTARITSLKVPKEADLTSWLKTLQANPTGGIGMEYQRFTGLSIPELVGLFPAAVSGKDGRFQINGIGRERLVDLRIEGPNIETSQVRVRTRPGKTLRIGEEAAGRGGPRITYYGAAFDHMAGPSLPIVGTVRDKDTGKPLTGVTVRSRSLPGNSHFGGGWVQTISDGDGRYRLTGLPKVANNVLITVPAEGQPYLGTTNPVGDCSGFKPVNVDIRLKRGVRVTGRVRDRATGKPVRARIDYFYFADNPHRKEYPRLSDWLLWVNREDGTFEGVVLPGRGLLAVRAWKDGYLTGVGADKIKGQDGNSSFMTYPHYCHASDYHTLMEVNPVRGTESVTCDLFVETGRTLTGRVLGPDGKPLAGTEAIGLGASYGIDQLKSAAFTVRNVQTGHPRAVAFLHHGKRLAGFVLLQGDEQGSLTVRLGPWGTITGRLVDANGLPRAGGFRVTFLAGGKGEEATVSGVAARIVQPDREGKFRIEGLVPGLKYNLATVKDVRVADWILRNFVVQPGQNKDVGDIAPGTDR